MMMMSDDMHFDISIYRHSSLINGGISRGPGGVATSPTIIHLYIITGGKDQHKFHNDMNFHLILHGSLGPSGL